MRTTNSPHRVRFMAEVKKRAAALHFLGYLFTGRQEDDDGCAELRRLPTGAWVVAGHTISFIFSERPTPKVHAEAMLLVVEADPVLSLLVQLVHFRDSKESDLLAVFSEGIFTALDVVNACACPRPATVVRIAPDPRSRRERRRGERQDRRDARAEAKSMVEHAEA